jgi:hypothetical protein
VAEPDRDDLHGAESTGVARAEARLAV